MNYKKEGNQRICLLLAVIIMISQLCVSNYAQSFFGSANGDGIFTPTSQISAPHSVIQETFVYANEVASLRSKGVSNYLNTHIFKKSTDFSVHLLTSFLALTSKMRFYIFKLPVFLCQNNTLFHNIIVHFIHEKDGAKDEISYLLLCN